MDRVIISPLIIYVLSYVILMTVGIPDSAKMPVNALFFLLLVPEVIFETGQFFRQINFPKISVFLLQISTICRQPWLLLPGTYPLGVYIASTNQLSITLCSLQRYNEALKINSRNVAILRRREPGSANLAGELINQANIFNLMGDMERAHMTAEEALVILDSKGTIADTSLVLNNLGTIYLSMNDSNMAMKLFNKSLEMRQAHKATDVQLAYAKGNIGYTLIKSNKFFEAEPYLRSAMLLAKHGCVEIKATVRNNLGEALRGQGKLEEAERFLQESLKIRKKSMSNGHPHLGYSYHNLGKLMVDRKSFDEAEKYFQMAMDIRAKFPGSKMQDFNETALEYAKMLRLTGREEEAAALMNVHRLEDKI